MAIATVKITGYTGGTLDLTGDDPYSLADPGWTPNVSRRKSSGLGGPLYNEVEEVLPLLIVSSTKAGASTGLAELIEAFDQAERWRRGENVAAVLLEVDPDASGDPVKAAILGASGGQRWMQLSPTWRMDMEAFAIGPFDVGLVRRGAWLTGTAEQQSEAVSTANNPGLMSVTFTGGSVNMPAPIKLTIDNTSPSGSHPFGVLLIGQSTSHVVFMEGESGSGTEYSSVADTDASGGNVIRRDPTTTNATILSSFGSLGVDASVRRMAGVISYRNLSSTIGYKVEFSVDGGLHWSRPVTIGTETQDPRLASLGITHSGHKSITTGLWIRTQPDGTGTGSTDGLEIDCIGLVAVDNEAGRVLYLDDVGRDANEDPIIDHALLSSISPIVKTELNNPRSYSGNPYLYGLSNTLSALLIGNELDFGRWRIRGATGTLVSIGMTADRRIAYLVPE